jgi:hypothetical protein
MSSKFPSVTAVTGDDLEKENQKVHSTYPKEGLGVGCEDLIKVR